MMIIRRSQIFGLAAMTEKSQGRLSRADGERLPRTAHPEAGGSATVMIRVNVNCEISISGIDPKGSYSGRMLFQFSPEQTATYFIFDANFQVSPTSRTWTDSGDFAGNDSQVKAQLRRNTL
jgi:hypothetical protein